MFRAVFFVATTLMGVAYVSAMDIMDAMGTGQDAPLDCGFDGACSNITGLTCRAAIELNDTNTIAHKCFTQEEVTEMFNSEPVYKNDAQCIPGSIVVMCGLSDGMGEVLPSVLQCNETHRDLCPPPSNCTITDPVTQQGVCCYPEHEEVDTHIRRKRVARKGGKKRKGGKGKGKGKDDDDDDDVEPLTTRAPDEKCRTVVSKGSVTKTFDGIITRVKLLTEFGYKNKKCKKDNFKPKKETMTFKVTHCYALFKVCYRPKVQTTTVAPFTTTEEKKKVKCVTLENLHGLVKHCPGKIISYKYKPAKKEKQGYGARQKGRCIRGLDYFVKENDEKKFVANANCPGKFTICHEKPGKKPTVPPFTTPDPGDKCKKIVVLKKTEKRFKSRITSFRLIKEFLHGHPKSVCEKGKNFKVRGGNVFVVNGGCKAVFEICTRREDQTPALTTVGPQKECEKVVNVRGTKRRFPGIIHSVKYIQVQQRRSGSHGGGYGYYYCQKDEDYIYIDDVFVANSRCPGFFEICWIVTPTTAPFTTTGHPEPVCEKVPIHKNGKTVFEGKIFTASILKQIPQFGYGFHFPPCKEGVNYFVKGDTLTVKNCFGLYKVCIFPDVQPFTTEDPDKKKKKKKRKNKKKKKKRGGH